MNVCMRYKDATQYKINSIKNRPNFFFNDMVDIKNFHPSLLEINKSTNTNIYHIEYITMKSLDHVNIDNENHLHLTFKI